VFLPGQQSTLFPQAPRGLVFGGDPGVPRTIVQTRWHQWSPRFGFAFDPSGDGRTAIRGAYGVFFGIKDLQSDDAVLSIINSREISIDPIPGGLADPYRTLPGGFPFPFNPPSTPEERANFKFLTPIVFSAFDPSIQGPIVQHWNFNIQRELFGSYIVTAAYVGSKTNHEFRSSDLLANGGVYTPGRSLDQTRPFWPDFGRIRTRNSIGNANYHSMQLNLNKQFSGGFTILANYTWAKRIDDADPMDPKDIHRERAVSHLSREHRYVTSFIWELPKLNGHAGLVRYIAGGWATNGIVTLQSGAPLNILTGVDNSVDGQNNDRPNLVGNPFLDSGRPRGELIEKYFDAAAFAPNATGTYGNAGRNLLVGPGLATVDFSVRKDIPVAERYKLQYRAEFFNLLNRPNLGDPQTSITNRNVGRITTTGPPRVIQMALKFIF
jgi:hypothetical protein